MIKNKKDVLKMQSDLQRMQSQFNQSHEDYLNQEIINNWNILKRDLAEKNLKSYPIDTVTTIEKGIPINLLRENGFHTIYDIRNESASALMMLNGIGEINGEAIERAVHKIKDAVYRETRPRVNPDDLSKEDVNLLETIYKKWNLLEVQNQLQSDLNALSEKLSPQINIAINKRNFFGALFQSKLKKEEIHTAINSLNENKKNFNEVKDKINEMQSFTVNQESLMRHFTNQNASYYTEIEKIVGLDEENQIAGLSEDIIETINQFPLNTDGLHIQLRKYQEFGTKYALHFKRTLLGDEMGLGKTIQALALINHVYKKDKAYSIVVCPLSVMANWRREIEQHSKVKTYTFHGNQRDAEFARWERNKGVLLTTYEHTLRLDLESLQSIDVLIVDEAHYVKNPAAQRSLSVYKLTEIAEYVLYMSGTPLENRLEEMKQLINVLKPDIANQLSEELHLLEPTLFKKTVAPVYLRRNRKEVLAELPELEVIPQWVDFGRDEKVMYYEAVKARKLMLMRRIAWLGGTPEKSPKLQKLLDICEKAYENGHKVLVFSFFRDVIRTLQSHLGNRTFEPITGDVSNDRRQEIIDEFTNSEQGTVLLSQITAGGVGLNIQAASIVVLCEPQWKPSIEEQAISRAYRMGQSRNVIVYRLLTENSIDVSMLEVLGQKAEIFDLYARESDVALQASANETSIHDESIKQKVLQMESERIINEKVVS